MQPSSQQDPTQHFVPHLQRTKSRRLCMLLWALSSPHLSSTTNILQHRALFLTYPPLLDVPGPTTSGTLFHATYLDAKWILERRPIKDISTSTSLVLLYQIATIDPAIHKLDEQFHKINRVLESIPLGKEAREREFGEKRRGNPVLGDYDCVIWTGDALRALDRQGLIDLKGRDAGS